MDMSDTPSRILLYKPCCIGDVVLTTPLLAALRRAYPDAHITWAVGTHSVQVIADHPLIDATLPTGRAANPARPITGLGQLVRQIRGGNYTLAVIPVRSLFAGLAIKLAGIPVRAGLDSAGRGRFHTIRATIDPAEVRHEADIYLDVGRALGIDVNDCWANIPVTDQAMQRILVPPERRPGLVVVHVGGGKNPGMTMAEKRPPVALLANVAARAAAQMRGQIAVIGSREDRARADELHEHLHGANPISLINILDFQQLAALGKIAALVIGPDTGVVHLMAAAGAKTVMIFGPSDPRRYAPFVPPGQAAAPWKPYSLPEGGVASGPPSDWSWEEYGVTAREVWEEAKTLL